MDVGRCGQDLGPEVFRGRPVMGHGPNQVEQGPVHALCRPTLLQSVGDGKLILYAVAR